MKLGSLDEAISDYESITGERFEYNPDTENMIVLPSNEFMVWSIGNSHGLRYFEIRQTYGRVKNFVNDVMAIMYHNDLVLIVTSTQRNPKAYIRKWKMSHLPTFDFDVDGRHYYFLVGNIVNMK